MATPARRLCWNAGRTWQNQADRARGIAELGPAKRWREGRAVQVPTAEALSRQRGPAQRRQISRQWRILAGYADQFIDC